MPRYIYVCPPKTVQCGPEAQKICGAPESAGPLALAQSAPPLNPALGAAELTIVIDNEGKLSNCFSINQLVGQNTILKKRTETLPKR